MRAARARGRRGTTRWRAFATRVVPRLRGARAHKGSHGGKIAVVGGSELYAGAPWLRERGGDAGGVRSVSRVHAREVRAGDEGVRGGRDRARGVVAGRATGTRERDGERRRDGESTTTNDLVEAFGRFRIDNAVIGPGLGGGAALEAVEALREATAACVVDADGLKALAPTSGDEDGAEARARDGIRRRWRRRIRWSCGDWCERRRGRSRGG